MRKKIIAGVAAVLMVASCIPANTNFGFSVTAPITASAASTLDLGDVVISTSKAGDIVLTADLLGEDTDATTLDIDFSGLKDTVVSYAGGSLSGKKVILMVDNKKPLKADVNLAHINFNDDLITEVGDNFAKDCKALQTVDFGDNITSIGASAFYGCLHLQGTSGTTLDLFNIVSIGNAAFQKNEELENIKFGKNIDTLGKNAFNGDISLKTLDFPASLTKIDDYCFKGCTKLESVKFEGNDMLSYIGISGFENCTSLTTVNVTGFNFNRLPNGADSIICGTQLFKGCTSLQNFTWSSNFTIIPGETFRKCTSLTKFTFEGGATGSVCQVIDEKAFYDCSSLTTIEFPDANTAIGAEAFENCIKLQQVVVSDQLTNVGDYAFKNCQLLTLYPRSDSSKTKNKVVLPSTWDEINKGTFRDCIGITQADISPATFIGEEAFENCRSLLNITIPDAVTTLHDKTFLDCESLKDVVVSKKLAVLGKKQPNGGKYGTPSTSDPAGEVFKNCKKLETFTPSDATAIPYTLQFPASLGGVQKSGFENCPAFKYINFAEGTRFSVVGEKAFYQCTGLLGSFEAGTAKDTIYMPTGVHDIFAYAFAECNNLKHIEFLGNVSTIGKYAFNKCTALEDVIMNDTIKQVRDSAFEGCESLESMPHTKEGHTAFSNIDTISASTFKGCKKLAEAYIPKNVTVIGSSAFANCEGMTKALWEKGSALATISGSAFSGAKNLAVFTSEDGGEDSTFPDSLNKIDANAFTKTALKTVIIGTPANGDKILLDSSAFSENEALETVDLSDSNIIEIPNNCFYKDTNLKTVYLPETSLVKLGKQAFSECHFLHTFGPKSANDGEYTIPESLTAIADEAFKNNYCMQVLNLPASATVLSMSMFNIYIKQEDVEKYGYTPLETINVDENNPNYTSFDGTLYNKDMTILRCRPVAKKDPTYTVPDSVTTIEQCACGANIYLENAFLTENVTSIADKAFNDCHNLNGVDFGSNGTVTLGKTVFTRSKGTITLYGTTGSTAQKYAENNKSKVTFVDNDSVASKLEILAKNGSAISGSVTLALKDRSYTFGCKQTTASGDEASDSLVWSSSNADVAGIDNTGKVTLKAKGSTTITVKNANGTAEAKITLTVGDETSVGDFILGDVTGDGKIDVTDLSKVAAHIKGKKQLSETAAKAADVNGNGKVDITDLSKIAAHVKGKKLLG